MLKAIWIWMAGTAAGVSQSVSVTYPEDYKALVAWTQGIDFNRLVLGADGKFIHAEELRARMHQHIAANPFPLDPKTGPGIVDQEITISSSPPENTLPAAQMEKLYSATTLLIGLDDETLIATKDGGPLVPAWLVGVETALIICDYPAQSPPIPILPSVVERLTQYVQTASGPQKEYVDAMLERIDPWGKLLKAVINKLELRKAYEEQYLAELKMQLGFGTTFDPKIQPAPLEIRSLLKEGETQSMSAFSDSAPDGVWIQEGDQKAGIVALDIDNGEPRVSAAYLQTRWHLAVASKDALLTEPTARLANIARKLRINPKGEAEPKVLSFVELTRLMKNHIAAYQQLAHMAKRLHEAHLAGTSDPEAFFSIIDNKALVESYYLPHNVEAFWDLEMLKHSLKKP